MNKLYLAVILFAGMFFLSACTQSFGGENSFPSSRVTATTTTTVAYKASIVLTSSSARKYAVITNTSGTIAYLAFHSTTTPNTVPVLGEANYVIPLTANGGTYIIDQNNLYTGQIIASSSAAVTIRALNAY